MGAEFISYCAVGPMKLSKSKKTMEKAYNTAKQFIRLGRRFLFLDSTECNMESIAREEEISALLNHPIFRHLELPEDIRWVKEYDGQPNRLVTDFIDFWENGSNDSFWRTVPRCENHPCKERKIVFCGEMSWGDEPDGAAYRLLKRADYAGLLPIFNIQ